MLITDAKNTGCVRSTVCAYYQNCFELKPWQYAFNFFCYAIFLIKAAFTNLKFSIIKVISITQYIMQAIWQIDKKMPSRCLEVKKIYLKVICITFKPIIYTLFYPISCSFNALNLRIEFAA